MTTSPETTARNNVATFSLIFGVISVIIALFIPSGAAILGLAAIVLGFLGLRAVKANGLQGRGQAITGIVLGVIGVVVPIFMIVVLGPAIAKTFSTINASLNSVP